MNRGRGGAKGRLLEMWEIEEADENEDEEDLNMLSAARRRQTHPSHHRTHPYRY